VTLGSKEGVDALVGASDCGGGFFGAQFNNICVAFKPSNEGLELMKLAVIRVVGAMSMSEDRVTAIVEIAIKRFQECAGEAWTCMVGLEKGGHNFAEQCAFGFKI
jgi:hypothetical protein